MTVSLSLHMTALSKQQHTLHKALVVLQHCTFSLPFGQSSTRQNSHYQECFDFRKASQPSSAG